MYSDLLQSLDAIFGKTDIDNKQKVEDMYKLYQEVIFEELKR